MGVDDTKIHPSFSSVSRENDLAVLHLSEALSGTNIGTIGLPTASHDPFAGDDVVVAGWYVFLLATGPSLIPRGKHFANMLSQGHSGTRRHLDVGKAVQGNSTRHLARHLPEPV